jgi:hypothetical protein
VLHARLAEHESLRLLLSSRARSQAPIRDDVSTPMEAVRNYHVECLEGGAAEVVRVRLRPWMTPLGKAGCDCTVEAAPAAVAATATAGADDDGIQVLEIEVFHLARASIHLVD